MLLQPSAGPAAAEVLHTADGRPNWRGALDEGEGPTGVLSFCPDGPQIRNLLSLNYLRRYAAATPRQPRPTLAPCTRGVQEMHKGCTSDSLMCIPCASLVPLLYTARACGGAWESLGRARERGRWPAGDGRAQQELSDRRQGQIPDTWLRWPNQYSRLRAPGGTRSGST
jgi:hypothetical protein